MAIFGRSKKISSEETTTSQPQDIPVYTSQLNWEGQYGYNALSQRQYYRQRRRMSQSHDASLSQQCYQSETSQRPIHITQNILIAPTLPLRQNSGSTTRGHNMSSISNLHVGSNSGYVSGSRAFNNRIPIGAQISNQGAAVCDLISAKLDEVITLIDGEKFSGDESDLGVLEPPSLIWQEEEPRALSRDITRSGKSSGTKFTNYFSKVNLYANSRLPQSLPPMKLYMTTFPLLCLAARYSENAYLKPKGQEANTHVESDWKLGTKAMVVKSVPMDDMNTIVIAIRGTETWKFSDWAVNLNSAPAVPDGFLDDTGNLCHSGFLCVARKMIRPVAARLRHLIEENPSRSSYSLLITGHSAGGAVASLLYSHMFSVNPETRSELNLLTSCFRRIHCVTFGVPPLSLLPLAKSTDPAFRKSIFMSFVNEGDPVVRADVAYMKSLIELLVLPAPSQAYVESTKPHALKSKTSNLNPSTYKSWNASSVNVSKQRPNLKKSKSTSVPKSPPIWPVPEAVYCNAGRLVLLRGAEKEDSHPKKKRNVEDRMNEGVIAQIVSDELLRGVIFGDIICHMMKLYARRIEILATNAVMGR